MGTRQAKAASSAKGAWQRRLGHAAIVAGGFIPLLYLVEEPDFDRQHLHAHIPLVLVAGFLVMSVGLRRWLSITVTVGLASGVGAWLTSQHGTAVGLTGLLLGWLVFLLVRGISTRSIFPAFFATVPVLHWITIQHPIVSSYAHVFGAAAGFLLALTNWGVRRRAEVPDAAARRTQPDFAIHPEPQSHAKYFAQELRRFNRRFARDLRTLNKRLARAFRAPDAPRTDTPAPAPESDLVYAFAQAMALAWTQLVDEIGDDATAVDDLKRRLADHGWCGLLISVVRAIETCEKIVNQVPELAKRHARAALLDPSMNSVHSHVTSLAIDIVIDRMWDTFKTATIDKVPTLSKLTDGDTIHSLRALALFVCPAPEEHEEVREHALNPLAADAQRILTDAVKARLVQLFNAEMTPA